MVSINVSGTEGYAENARSLIEQWQDISFAEHHEPIVHLVPTHPCCTLDVGAGIGTDAAAFAAMGHTVVAVEPVDTLRVTGLRQHPSPRIEWLDDSLPDLAILRSRRKKFDFAMLSAVWMHLDENERRQAMPNVSALLRDGAILVMSLRHGPVPKGRRMFDVSAEETIQLAKTYGLRTMLNVQTESIQRGNRHMGVTWTRLAFAKDGASCQPRPSASGGRRPESDAQGGEATGSFMAHPGLPGASEHRVRFRIERRSEREAT